MQNKIAKDFLMIDHARFNKLMDSPVFALLTGEFFLGKLTIFVRIVAIALAIILKKSIWSVLAAVLFGYLYVIYIIIELLSDLIQLII